MAGVVIIVARPESRVTAGRAARGLPGSRIIDPANPGEVADAKAVVIVWDKDQLADPAAAKSLGFTLEAAAPIYHVLPEGTAQSALPLAFADMEVCTAEALAGRIAVERPQARAATMRPSARSRRSNPALSAALVASLIVIIGGGALWQTTRQLGSSPISGSDARVDGGSPALPAAPAPVLQPTPAEPAPQPAPIPTLPGQILPPAPPPPPPPSTPAPTTPEPDAEPPTGSDGDPEPVEPAPAPVTPPAPEPAPPTPGLSQPSGEASNGGLDGRTWFVAAGAALLGALAAAGVLAMSRRRTAAVPEPVSMSSGATPPLAPNFISYNMGDRPKVSSYVSDVEKSGARCWMFDRDQGAASQWAAEIVRALRQSDRVIVFLSPKSCASPHVCRELTLADRFRKPIVPVMLEPCEPPDDVVYFLASLHELRVFEVGEETARRLLREQVATIH